MIFLYPLYFIAAVAILVPIFFHLISRRKPTVQQLPTFIFLEQALNDFPARSRLRGLLLLLLRILLILLLVLLFVSPFVEGASSPLNKYKNILLVIDNSPTMLRFKKGTTLLQMAKKQASRMAVRLSAYKKLYYMPLLNEHSKPQGRLSIGSIDSLLQKIRETKAVCGDYSAKSIFSIISSFNNEAKIDAVVLFSNMCGKFWKERVIRKIPIFVVPLHSPGKQKNLYLRRVQLPQKFLFSGTRAVGTVQVVKNFATPQTTLLKLYRKDALIYKKRILLKKNVTAVTFPLVLQKAGKQIYRITIEDSYFVPDNTQYFTVTVMDHFKIAFSNRPETAYIAAALRALFKEKVRFTSVRKLDSDVVLFELNEQNVGKIKKLLNAKKPFLLYASARINTATFASAWERLGFGSLAVSRTLGKVEVRSFFPGTSYAFGARFSLKYGTAPLLKQIFPGGQTLFAGKNRSYGILINEKAHKMAYIPFLLDGVESDFVAKKEFPLFIQKLLHILLQEKHQISSNLDLLSPYYMTGSSCGNGIYRNQGTTVAVNVPEENSRFDRYWNLTEAKKKYAGSITILRISEPFSSVTGKVDSLQYLILGLVFIVRIAEMLLARRVAV